MLFPQLFETSLVLSVLAADRRRDVDPCAETLYLR